MALISSGDVFLLREDRDDYLVHLPSLYGRKIKSASAGSSSIFVPFADTIGSVAADKASLVEIRDIDSIVNVELPDGDDIRMIAACRDCLLALGRSGKLYSAATEISQSPAPRGVGGAASLPDGNGWKEIPSFREITIRYIACGGSTCFAITQGGDVYSWGTNFAGEAANLGSISSVPRLSSRLTKLKILKIAVGGNHCLGITGLQQCVAWGENTCGQLGIGKKLSSSNQPLFVNMPARTDKENCDDHHMTVVDIAAGWAHSVFVDNNGHAYSFGLNSHGQLGLNDTRSRWSPEVITTLREVTHIGCGKLFTAVWAMGTTRASRGARGVYYAGKNLRSAPPVGAVVDADPEEPNEVTAATKDHDGLFSKKFVRRQERPHIFTATGNSTAKFTGPLDMRPPFPSEYTLSAPITAISSMLASDNMVYVFASTHIAALSPSIANLSGGTRVAIHVTGLSYPSSTPSSLGQARVRLTRQSPALDHIVDAQIDELSPGRICFDFPDLSLSPLAPLVESATAPTFLGVQLSLDDGLSWTALDETQPKIAVMKFPERQLVVVPNCASMTGGAPLTVFLPGAPGLTVEGEPAGGPPAVPDNLPDDSLLALFTIECRSKAVDSEDFDDVYADREMLVDAKPREKVKIKVPGWRSINGVSCICPSFDPDIIGSSAGVSVQVSLDEGQTLLGPPLPFKVFSFMIDRIVPAVGEAAVSTRMEVVLGGRMPVVTKKPRIGAILPGKSDAAGRRRRPLMREMPEAVAEARVDGTIRIFFTMPSLEDLLPEKTVAVAERYLKIPIEVSLNDGAEYSEDGFSFTYLLPQGAEGDSPTFTAAPGLYKKPEEWTEEDNRIDVSAAIPAGTEMCVRLTEGDLPVDLVYADAKIRLRYVLDGEDEAEGAELKPPADLEVMAGISFHGEKDIPVVEFTTPDVTASQLAMELGTVVAMEVSFAIDGQHFHEVVDDDGQAVRFLCEVSSDS